MQLPLEDIKAGADVIGTGFLGYLVYGMTDMRSRLARLEGILLDRKSKREEDES